MIRYQNLHFQNQNIEIVIFTNQIHCIIPNKSFAHEMFITKSLELFKNYKKMDGKGCKRAINTRH